MLEVGADQKLAGGGAPGGAGRRGGATPRRESFRKKKFLFKSLSDIHILKISKAEIKIKIGKHARRQRVPFLSCAH